MKALPRELAQLADQLAWSVIMVVEVVLVMEVEVLLALQKTKAEEVTDVLEKEVEAAEEVPGWTDLTMGVLLKNQTVALV